MKTFSCLILLAASATNAAPFSFDSIERWTGSGACRAALVVDWHDGTRPHALAWGYRFDPGPGETGLKMLADITTADPGLAAILANNQPVEITYARPTRAGDILPGTGNHPGLARCTAYTFDHADPGVGAWDYWTCDGWFDYAQSNMAHAAASSFALPLADYSWHAWSLATSAPSSPL